MANPVTDPWEEFRKKNFMGTPQGSNAGSGKISLDRFLDPLFAFTLLNGAAAYGGDQFLDYVSKHADSNEGLAMMAAYTGIGAAALTVNRFVVWPTMKAISKMHKNRIAEGRTAGGLSWVRSAVQLGAISALCYQFNMADAVQNYASDFTRVRDALSRDSGAYPAGNRHLADVWTEVPEFPVWKPGRKQVAGMIEGERIDGMFSLYTGLSGTVPNSTSVEFKKQLSRMWDQKQRIAATDDIKGVVTSAVSLYPKKGRTTMTFSGYCQQIHNSMLEVQRGINWSTENDPHGRVPVKELKGLTNNEVRLVAAIAMSLNERDLISYAQTELMPGFDGKLNVGVLDFLLRNAGREYVELIPALGDPLVSFGPYQFTHFALRDAVERQGDERGASIINRALPPPLRIVGEVKDLHGNDHHKAAYLFAINNVADLVKSLTRSQYLQLERVSDAKMFDIVNFIATAHHRPANAIICAKSWLSDGTERSYGSMCDSTIAVYSKKTQANIAALYTAAEHPSLSDIGRVQAGAVAQHNAMKPR